MPLIKESAQKEDGSQERRSQDSQR